MGMSTEKHYHIALHKRKTEKSYKDRLNTE